MGRWFGWVIDHPIAGPYRWSPQSGGLPFLDRRRLQPELDQPTDSLRPGRQIRLSATPIVEIAQLSTFDPDIDRLAIDVRSPFSYFLALSVVDMMIL